MLHVFIIAEQFEWASSIDCPSSVETVAKQYKRVCIYVLTYTTHTTSTFNAIIRHMFTWWTSALISIYDNGVTNYLYGPHTIMVWYV